MASGSILSFATEKRSTNRERRGPAEGIGGKGRPVVRADPLGQAVALKEACEHDSERTE